MAGPMVIPSAPPAMDWKLHSKRVEKMWNHTRNEWRRCINTLETSLFFTLKGPLNIGIAAIALLNSIIMLNLKRCTGRWFLLLFHNVLKLGPYRSPNLQCYTAYTRRVITVAVLIFIKMESNYSLSVINSLLVYSSTNHLTFDSEALVAVVSEV
jgi:hypothetical protein